MNEDAYYSNTYIRKTRDRLYKILGRQPSIEEIYSLVIGLSYEELLDLVEHEVINSLLYLAGERDLKPDDVKKECRKWGLNDDEVEKLCRWASDAGLFEAGTDPYAGELKPQNEEPALELKTDYPSLEELIAVKKKIPDFKETVSVGKNEVIRNFRLETLDEIKEDLIKHRQSHELITAGDLEFELRNWSVPKNYVQQLAEFVYTLNANGVPPQNDNEVEESETKDDSLSATEIQNNSLDSNPVIEEPLDNDDSKTNKRWDLIDRFKNIIRTECEDQSGICADSGLTLVALYAFYHYFNADITRIEEMLSGIVQETDANLHVLGIFTSLLDEESVDFLSIMHEDYFRDVFLNDIEDRLNSLAQKMAYIVIKTPYMNNEEAIEIYTGLNRTLSDSNIYTNRILCDFDLPIEERIEIQRLVANHSVKNKNVLFEILFKEDIQSEIDEIENPKEYVDRGQLMLFDPESICYFGEEKSFLSMVSAKSLKQLFLDYGNKGLLDSNLRFFVSSKKIDPKIVNTIQNEPNNFVYYNNGIIVTCDDYQISGNNIKLTNFSIVNGGQTTNLIGRTTFDIDFPVICKVIKNKYADIEGRVEFLSKVAEASNTQKPINAKDLIANRKEQRLLKLQFERAGIFLRVKRGEKIDKSVYKSNWQNASNDEIAQFIYSMVYQCPGASKNSKSKLLETEHIYKIIFESSYTDDFFISIQHLKVAYSEWLKRLRKTESKSSTKFALAKNALLITLGAYGLVYKTAINEELREYLINEKDLSSSNASLKLHIQQNDIGQTNLFRKETIENNKWNQYYAIFEELFGYVLIPAYEAFKKAFPTYAYSHFVKSDGHYYNYVVPQVVSLLNKKEVIDNLLVGTEHQKVVLDYEKLINVQEQSYKPGLEQELIDYRRKIYYDSKKQIQAYEVISNRQLASVMKYLPKTKMDMSRFCGFKTGQLNTYGDHILQIIKKYTNVDDIV